MRLQLQTEYMLKVIIIGTYLEVIFAGMTSQEVHYLNELPLDKLLSLKTSLQEFRTPTYENVTATTPAYLETFGAQAMAMKSAIKRGDYEEGVHKKDSPSKVSHIFSMSVTTLAFLAFGGYLLCLIVQAVKAKQTYHSSSAVQPTTTVFLNAGIKKRPPATFSSYGRRRQKREDRSMLQIDLPPEELFSALLQICEGYAKWSDGLGHLDRL